MRSGGMPRPFQASAEVSSRGAFSVALEDGDRDHPRVEGEPLGRGEELPGVGDGLFLEVVAEGPVAEHLEAGEVALVADLVDVAGADALLVVGEPLAGRDAARRGDTGRGGACPPS